MSTNTNKLQARKVTTPKFRAAFAWVFKPQPPMEGSGQTEGKYGVTMLFDAEARKTVAYKNLLALATAAAKEKFGDKLKSDGNGWFHGLRNPIRNGDEKSELDGYEGCMFASATTKMQPGVVDAQLNRIISDAPDIDGFYSGCYARATVTAYGYDKAGNKGVAFGLQNLQKLADGEPFSGRARAENDFEAIETADEGQPADEF